MFGSKSNASGAARGAVLLGVALALTNSAPAAAAVPTDTALPVSTARPVPAEVLLDRANSLAASGRFRRAMEEYSRAARVQREEGVLPAEAMWKLAQLHYGANEVEEAAFVLFTLARRAEQMGNPTVQARALLEAALLYHSIGREDDATRATNRLRRLRSSPFLSDELNAEIGRRLALD